MSNQSDLIRINNYSPYFFFFSNHCWLDLFCWLSWTKNFATLTIEIEIGGRYHPGFWKINFSPLFSLDRIDPKTKKFRWLLETHQNRRKIYGCRISEADWRFYRVRNRFLCNRTKISSVWMNKMHWCVDRLNTGCFCRNAKGSGLAGIGGRGRGLFSFWYFFHIFLISEKFKTC